MLVVCENLKSAGSSTCCCPGVGEAIASSEPDGEQITPCSKAAWFRARFLRAWVAA